jgi:hypothetical protein
MAIYTTMHWLQSIEYRGIVMNWEEFEKKQSYLIISNILTFAERKTTKNIS